MKKILMISLIASLLAVSTAYAQMQSRSSAKSINCACQASNLGHMQLCANMSMHHHNVQTKAIRKSADQDTRHSVRQDKSEWSDINNITRITGY